MKTPRNQPVGASALPPDILDNDGVTLWRRVDALKAGDRVDLENDPYADVFDRVAGELKPEFEFEFQTVEGSQRETRACLRVDFEGGFSCGFPADHWLPLAPEK